MLMDDVILEKFAISEIIKQFPRSGQKQVLLVKHNTYGIVVLKIVDCKNERVEREIRIVHENNFENVPRILEVGEYEYREQIGLYFYEEYIDGESLKIYLNGEKMDLAEAIKLTEQMLYTIVRLEEKRIVHRDIKPDNILHSKTGDWYLIDFGIARALDMGSLTLTEAQVGPHTPGYGAPELFQYTKKDIDSRADIFSLGVVVFEAVTGKHPFVRGDELDLNEIWYNTVTIVPQAVEIDGDVDMQFIGLLQTFMQKHVTRRPATAKKAWAWFESVKKELMG
ncbi:MAG: serine/threonine protein kinase [Muribaculum sp.]|nr:serine/threonine protein kinase [Muribaculum sp.]